MSLLATTKPCRKNKAKSKLSVLQFLILRKLEQSEKIKILSYTHNLKKPREVPIEISREVAKLQLTSDYKMTQN